MKTKRKASYNNHCTSYRSTEIIQQSNTWKLTCKSIANKITITREEVKIRILDLIRYSENKKPGDSRSLNYEENLWPNNRLTIHG